MKKKPVLIYQFLLLLMLFLSCTARINGSLQNNGQADLVITASLEPGITRLIRALSMASGTSHQGPVLDGPAISTSMSAAPGIASVSLKNTTPESIEGPVKITRIGDFLASGRASGFITFEQGVTGNPSGGGRCAIQISLDSGPEILNLISSEIRGYLEALMAPIATGETVAKTEYLALVGSVYGRTIAEEISGAVIRASVDFPGPVQSAKGGTFSGKRVEFNIPLLDLLVLETPLSYEVVWR